MTGIYDWPMHAAILDEAARSLRAVAETLDGMEDATSSDLFRILPTVEAARDRMLVLAEEYAAMEQEDAERDAAEEEATIIHEDDEEDEAVAW